MTTKYIKEGAYQGQNYFKFCLIDDILKGIIVK
jgi:hypothetical protein